MKKIIFTTLIVLFIDQASKFYVKTHFELGESLAVFSWFKITFVENPGMAYGIHFGGLLGKYLLVILRLFLCIMMIVYFRKWIRGKASNFLIIPMSMIFAGALGNIIDGMFYGLIFDKGTTYQESIGSWIEYSGIAKISSFGHGYSSFMKGCVVDMLHFPLINWVVPNNWPVIGGGRIEFFKYIFNIADSSITVGAIFLLLFRKKAFPKGLDF
ncbi:MAG: lipoprotein signal peptidase [Bergeyella sp.]|nr:lipoprotein signal peptidase [Bergeyella sp.]